MKKKEQTSNTIRPKDDIITERGKVFQKGSVQKGVSHKGIEYYKQDVVVEIPVKGRSPKHIVLSLFKEEISDFDDIDTGDNVEISYYVEARMYQDRWYNSVKYWDVNKITETQAQTTTVSSTPQTLFDFDFSNPDFK